MKHWFEINSGSNYFTGKRCIVTGAAGFIGKRLVPHLQASGAEVTPWTRREVDLLDASAVIQRIQGDRPEIVFHLASAGTRPEHAHSELAIYGNLRMAEHLSAGILAMESECRLVVAGSVSEYGGGEKSVVSEDRVCQPVTKYGIGKLAASLYFRSEGLTSGLDVIILRLFGVYGPGESKRRLIPAVLEAIASEESLDLSDGTQIRDFMHVADVCEGFLRAAQASSLNGQILNLGTGDGLTVRAVCEWIAQEKDADQSLLRFGAKPRSPFDADNDLIVADVTALRSALDWVPKQRLTKESLVLNWTTLNDAG